MADARTDVTGTAPGGLEGVSSHTCRSRAGNICRNELADTVAALTRPGCWLTGTGLMVPARRRGRRRSGRCQKPGPGGVGLMLMPGLPPSSSPSSPHGSRHRQHWAWLAGGGCPGQPGCTPRCSGSLVRSLASRRSRSSRSAGWRPDSPAHHRSRHAGRRVRICASRCVTIAGNTATPEPPIGAGTCCRCWRFGPRRNGQSGPLGRAVQGACLPAVPADPLIPACRPAGMWAGDGRELTRARWVSCQGCWGRPIG